MEVYLHAFQISELDGGGQLQTPAPLPWIHKSGSDSEERKYKHVTGIETRSSYLDKHSCIPTHQIYLHV
jgi:hypothetical protein